MDTTKIIKKLIQIYAEQEELEIIDFQIERRS